MKLCKEQCGRTTERPDTSRCRTCRRNRKAEKAGVRPGGPRVLLIDIETSLQLSYHFGQWGVNINPELTVEPTRMLCFAAKWLGEPDTMFFSEWDDRRNPRQHMVANAWLLLDEADVVVHYYGSRFDIPHLNREFLTGGFTPPSPYKQVDLKLAVSKRFKFDSNKLEMVSRVLGLEGKVKHEGAGLWRKVQEGDAAAQGRMETYNRRDTELLEDVYDALLPWIPNLPHRHLYDDGGCPSCGASDELLPSGKYRTKVSVYQQYTCNWCGSWFRGSKRLYGVDLQEVAL